MSRTEALLISSERTIFDTQGTANDWCQRHAATKFIANIMRFVSAVGQAMKVGSMIATLSLVLPLLLPHVLLPIVPAPNDPYIGGRRNY
jgi:hypothetical protein